MDREARLPPEEGAGLERELRLALVCYGGVSLAIYMHGVTKELHRLVSASRMFRKQPEQNPFDRSTTEHAYWSCLHELRDKDPEGTSTSVVVDIVSGTSAGGINGVFLAKALAHDLSQDALRNLWMDKGDIAKLVDAPQHLPPFMRYGWLASKALTHPLRPPPPLSGDRMAQWLFDALSDMDASQRGSGESLVPQAQALELFVTATDYYGFVRTIPAGTVFAHDRSHRHVLRFRFDREAGVDHFSPSASHNAGLTFAARATSSFPGAFPPISIEGLERLLSGKGAQVGDFASDLFRLYELQGDNPRATYFVDGGVLDNFPFGHAIDAIRAKPADREVGRRLVYLQPDPGQAPASPSGKEPGLLGTVWKTLSSIPRNEPIVDDLLEVREINEHVQTVREIVETSFDPIREIIDQKAPPGGFSPDASAESIEQWQSGIHDGAREFAGVGYPTYVRLKLHSVIAEFGNALTLVCRFPQESDHAFFARTLVHEWARAKGLLLQASTPLEPQVAFLRSFDVNYRLRRVQFLIAGVNWLYGKPEGPPRRELDRAKECLWSIAEELQGIVSGGSLPGSFRARLVEVFEPERARRVWTACNWEPEAMLAEYQKELDSLSGELETYLAGRLTELGQQLYRHFLEVAASWPVQIRKDLLVRYLGFPIWDAVLYPVHALAKVNERDAVEVVRMSPDEATRVEAGGAAAKLKGVGFHHFGAFFKREWRENDYVWGRLDGAELLIRMLTGDARSAHLTTALQAIAHEERNLKGARDALAKVERAAGPVPAVS